MIDLIIFIAIMVVIRNFLADGKHRNQRGQQTGKLGESKHRRPDIVREILRKEQEEKERRQRELEEKARRQRAEKEKREKERRLYETKRREQERTQGGKQAAKSDVFQNAVVQEKTGAEASVAVKKKLEEPEKIEFKLEHYLDPLTAPFYPGNEPKKEDVFRMDDYLFPTLASFYPDVEDIHEKVKK